MARRESVLNLPTVRCVSCGGTGLRRGAASMAMLSRNPAISRVALQCDHCGGTGVMPAPKPMEDPRRG